MLRISIINKRVDGFWLSSGCNRKLGVEIREILEDIDPLNKVPFKRALSGV